MPYSYIYNTKIYFSKITNYITQKKKYLTAEYLFNLSNKKNKNSFFVLVLGESARSDRFSLNGYKRNTNPLLSTHKNLVSYTNFHSLDTSTKPAVPHIFLRDLKLKATNKQKETSFLHVLNHLGFKAFWFSLWRTRPNSLMYDISLETNVTAYGTQVKAYSSTNTPNSFLYDQTLLEPLKETLKKNGNGIIVLHTKGSHYTYYNRAPKEFQVYSPNCTYDCINNVSALNNTYDNTILYTDFFLNEVINILKDKDAIFLYVSDHGESLGENGVFAHSAPYETAPKEQTHIPMMWWASDKFLSNQENSKKFERIKSNFDKRLDQSYIFHSALDCIGVDSPAINKNKSVCRRLLQK